METSHDFFVETIRQEAAYCGNPLDEKQPTLIGFRLNGFGQSNRWDDFIGAIYKDGFVLFGGCTTDPSPYWADPERREKMGWPKGALHICSGMHRGVYSAGFYKGHSAFIQRAPMLMWRDVDGSFTWGPTDTIKRELCGVHIHHGNDRPFVDAQSAGCQVICSPKKLDMLSQWVAEQPTDNRPLDYLLINCRGEINDASLQMWVWESELGVL